MKLNNIGNLRSANLVLILAALTSTVALAGGGPTGGGPTGTVACSVIQNFKVVPGVNPRGLPFAAVWTSVTAQPCGGPAGVYQVTVTTTNLDTNQLERIIIFGFTQSSGTTLDDDSAQFSTNYRVDVEVKDPSGTVIAKSTTTTVTPGPGLPVSGSTSR